MRAALQPQVHYPNADLGAYQVEGCSATLSALPPSESGGVVHLGLDWRLFGGDWGVR